VKFENLGMPKLIWRALAAGTTISALLFYVERFVPRHAPRTVALPGWIAIIALWGFEGERGGVWAWIVFLVANAFAYSILALVVLLVLDGFSRRRGKSGVHQ
jgi:hypothetical protein